jgi:hypothetical protein
MSIVLAAWAAVAQTAMALQIPAVARPEMQSDEADQAS